jgi:2-polyprenyl-3-methyl-5-hydroxy-6-metoxy-1,4-benzoquinol methylase
VRSSAKYYSAALNREIEPHSEACELGEWGLLHGRAPCARHPAGFHVFLSPDALPAADEYAEADPYAVEENRNSAFQRRRELLTVDVVRDAVRGVAAPRVLDVGCGQGHITNALLAALPGADVSGADYSMSAVAYAHRHFPGIDFVVADAHALPYGPEYFDVVVCNNLWEHVADPVLLLGRMLRVLRPGGRVVVSTPSRYRLRNLVRVVLGKPVALMSPHHVTEYSVGQVLEQLRFGGCDDVRIVTRRVPLRPLERALRSVVAVPLSVVGSHHQLEATVLFSARKRPAAIDDARARPPAAGASLPRRS